jgi:hypothetical protein
LSKKRRDPKKQRDPATPKESPAPVVRVRLGEDGAIWIHANDFRGFLEQLAPTLPSVGRVTLGTLAEKVDSMIAAGRAQAGAR